MKEIYILFDVENDTIIGAYPNYEIAAYHMMETVKEDHPGEWEEIVNDYECEADLESDLFAGLDVVDDSIMRIESTTFVDSF